MKTYGRMVYAWGVALMAAHIVRDLHWIAGVVSGLMIAIGSMMQDERY